MLQVALGYALIILGVISSSGGVLGLYKFKGFYKKILVSGNIDTVYVLLTMLGAMLLAPSGEYRLKVIFILFLTLVTSPLSSHAIMESAYHSGYREEE